MLTTCGGCDRIAQVPGPDDHFRLTVRSRSGDLTTKAIPWGHPTAFGTPAYWITQYLHNFGTGSVGNLSMGGTLVEEVVARLLGGFGITAELADAAFHRLQTRDLIRRGVTALEVENALSTPLHIGARRQNYRFPRQRASRIVRALNTLSDETLQVEDPLYLRGLLLEIPGVGPKTASWVVRNLTSSDSVAVIDVHIERAGRMAGIFFDDWKLPIDYLSFEIAFVSFARAGGVPTAGLDSLMWDQMRRFRRSVPPTLEYHDDTCLLPHSSPA